jgi:hypothetical protein
MHAMTLALACHNMEMQGKACQTSNLWEKSPDGFLTPSNHMKNIPMGYLHLFFIHYLPNIFYN